MTACLIPPSGSPGKQSGGDLCIHLKQCQQERQNLLHKGDNI
jgi:hypothetical protein